jgi:hypothetical protein
VIKFVIEEAALSQNWTDEAMTKATHMRAIDLWMRHGILILNDDRTELSKALATMPQSRRKMWQTALISENFRKRNLPLGDPDLLFADEASLLSLSHLLNLACLEETRATCLLGETEFAKSYGEKTFEICRFDAVDQSQSFKANQARWDRPICAGERRDDIWSSRFADLATYSTRIAIVDRYAGADMVFKYGKGHICGLARFIKLIGNLDCVGRKKKSLNIYISDHEITATDFRNVLHKYTEASTKNLASVHVYIAKDKEFKEIAHDRFVRFDGAVVTLGRGISILGDEICQNSTTCALHADEDRAFERKIERQLQRQSNHMVLL